MSLIQILRWDNTPLIWGTSFAGSLYKDMEKGSFVCSFSACSCLASPSLYWHSLPLTSLWFRHLLKTSWDIQHIYINHIYIYIYIYAYMYICGGYIYMYVHTYIYGGVYFISSVTLTIHMVKGTSESYDLYWREKVQRKWKQWRKYFSFFLIS